MSEQVEIPDIAGEATVECPRCLKAQPLCVCDSVAPIENRLSLLILQHPQEQDRALGLSLIHI